MLQDGCIGAMAALRASMGQGQDARTCKNQDAPTDVALRCRRPYSTMVTGAHASLPQERPHPCVTARTMLSIATPPSKRKARKDRGPSEAGTRSLGRINVASVNVNGLKDGHKFSELARTLKERNIFCAGISGRWHSGDGSSPSCRRRHLVYLSRPACRREHSSW